MTPLAEIEAGGSVARVAEALAGLGLETPILAVPASTRTAAEAAAVVGCQVAQIAKTVVFRDKTHDTHIVVVACGSNRICTQKLAQLTGSKIGRADADFVRERSGFAIGGVSPVGHRQAPSALLIDEELLTLGMSMLRQAARLPFSAPRAPSWLPQRAGRWPTSRRMQHEVD